MTNTFAISVEDKYQQHFKVTFKAVKFKWLRYQLILDYNANRHNSCELCGIKDLVNTANTRGE